MMDAYREMLTNIKSAVTRNYSSKCINNIMNFVSGSASQNFGLLQEFYQTTLKALEEVKNEVGKLSTFTIFPLVFLPRCDKLLSALQRFGFKTNLKLCNIWFDMGEYGQMNKILKELHKSRQKENGSDDQKKGNQLKVKNNKKLKVLEVYAIEIQMYTEMKNNKKLKVEKVEESSHHRQILVWMVNWTLRGRLKFMIPC